MDGESTLLPASFDWEAGSTHTIGFGGSVGTSQGVGGYRLTFDSWSDGGDATHDITVTAEPTTITANFTRRVSVNTATHGPGRIIVQPSGSDGRYHDLSATVQLTARPSPGYRFVSWFVDLSGTKNPQPLFMDSRKWVRAFFLDENTYESAKLTSGRPFNLLFGPGSSRPEGYNGYWIVVPPGATQLDIRLETTTPGAEVDLYANRDIRPRAVYGANNTGLAGYESAYSSTGPGGNESISITPASNPRLQPGPYFIAVHVRTKGLRVRRTLTADVAVSTEEIAANVPHFNIPASLITTREGEVPPPQILEVRNSGRGTLDYQIATDQPWLSVSPEQGSVMEEPDIIEIRADPMAMEPGAFEGEITITERQPPAGGFAGLFSDHTPAWPVTVPVTFIVIPEGEEDPSDTTPTIPEDDEEDSENDEEQSGGLAVAAQLRSPQGVDVDAGGNLYIADSGGNRIRRVDSSGTISSFAGIGEQGYTGDGGPAIEARLFSPYDVALDGSGNLFIAEAFNNRIRKVDASGTITTIAGTGEGGFSGDGGAAVEAQLSFPSGLAADASGNLFIADYDNQRIRRVDASGIISTFAGGGDTSGDGGPAVQARLGYPSGVDVDASGNLYIAVLTNSTIRRVDPSGTITTIAGVGGWGFSGDGGPAVQAHLNAPPDVEVDAGGNLYIADENNHRIRRVDPSGTITTFAGTGERGFSGDGGPAGEAQLDHPRGVAVDASGNLFIADYGNKRIRKVDASGTITTIAGTGEMEQ